MANSLTPKQQRFVEEYLLDLNATQAAIRAGYSANNSDVTGPRLLGNVRIKTAVDAALAKASEDLGISKEWILTSLKNNAQRAMQVEAVLNSDGEPLGVYRYEGSVANRALELLGKHRGMFSDKVEVTGKDGGPVQVWKWGKREIKF